MEWNCQSSGPLKMQTVAFYGYLFLGTNGGLQDKDDFRPNLEAEIESGFAIFVRKRSKP